MERKDKQNNSVTEKYLEITGVDTGAHQKSLTDHEAGKCFNIPVRKDIPCREGLFFIILSLPKGYLL